LDGVSLIIREKYLNALMIPIIRRIEEIMSVADSSLDIILIWELADLITCIGSLGKGFPDYDETKDSQQASWAFLMKSTLQGVLIVLSKLNVHPSIREAVRATNLVTFCLAKNDWLSWTCFIRAASLVSGVRYVIQRICQRTNRLFAVLGTYVSQVWKYDHKCFFRVMDPAESQD
jgi:hypothetical protein